jgi:hypothetical protein
MLLVELGIAAGVGFLIGGPMGAFYSALGLLILVWVVNVLT